MNRKARRAARRHDRGADGVGGARLSDLFGAALRLHQSGQLGEAADIYRQILASDPGHADSLQNLGAIAIGAGRHEIAVDLFRRAIAADAAAPNPHRNLAIALLALGRPDQAAVHGRRAVALAPGEVDAHLILGDALERQDQFAEALACYARAVALAPSHAEAHAGLGRVQKLQGALDRAAASFERALALDPRHAATHFHLGNLRLEQGQPQQAIECYLRAIEIVPDHMESHTNLCSALMAQNKYAEAIAHYRQILAYKPDFAAGYRYLAVAYLGTGNARRALDAVRTSLRLAETPHGKAVFAACLQNLAAIEDDAEMLDLLVRAISEPWDRPDQLIGHGLTLVKADAEIAACITRACAAWPARLPAEQLFGAAGLRAVCRNRLLHCILENAALTDLDVERFLTSVRATLLGAASMAAAHGAADTAPDADALAFYVALARQCFVNEYVYAQSAEERAAIEVLRTALAAALQTRAAFPVLWLVACAAYAPLHTLAGCEALLDQTFPAAVDALVTQQIREPREEIRLRGTIPQLTPIEDRVSVEVRHQYEQNPYPRWIKAAVAKAGQSPDMYLRQIFHAAPFRNLGKAGAIDLLNAGCGTGQQLLDLAQNIAGARTLAVDLSLASLGYAKRQAEALGLRNIEFGQADIMRLGALGRSFDIIECCGVLHHLDDPEAGWRVLVALLRPNGLMRVALYSELARAQIVVAQNFAAQRCADRTAEDIRQFRQDLLAHPDQALVRAITGIGDFFSISPCRDLLLHAREHRMTLPWIKCFLAGNDLQFLEFHLPPTVRRRYAERFPEDATMTDLDRWHVFEQENPRTFIGMYQFWLQKGAGGYAKPVSTSAENALAGA